MRIIEQNKSLEQLSRKRWFEIENKLIMRWNFTCTYKKRCACCKRYKSFHSNTVIANTHALFVNSFCTVYGTIHYHCLLHVYEWLCCIGSECVEQSCENESGWYIVAAAASARKSARFSPIACGFRWLITLINILVRISFFFIPLFLSLGSILFAHIQSSRRDANQRFNNLRTEIGSKFKLEKHRGTTTTFDE